MLFVLGITLSCGETTSNRPEADATSGGSASGSANPGDGGSAPLPIAGSKSSGSGGASGVGATGGVETSGGATEMSAAGDNSAPAAGAAGTSSERPPIKPTAGCGLVASRPTGVFVKYTLPTSGVKDNNCADSLNGQPKCGPWSLEREYYLWLPPDYDKDRAYPLVVQGPGCGGIGTQVYPLWPDMPNVDEGVAASVIRVGLTPPPNSIGHGTNPGQGCFDDKEGDDSVDFVLFEKLLDALKTQVCYDENRVYVSGNSSGAWLANELACKYAGDTQGYAVRGVATNMGGLPTDPKFSPTCTKNPLAGIWVRATPDLGAGFDSTKFAIARAMAVNGCSSTDLDFALNQGQVENFPIGGGKPDDTCKRITQCASSEPLVVCTLPGNDHGAHDDVANPAFASFMRALAAKP